MSVALDVYHGHADQREDPISVQKLRGRSVSSFPVESGVFSGPVESYTVLDASLSQQLPWLESITLTLGVDNLLDQRHREFVGAPVLGRLVLARIRADF